MVKRRKVLIGLGSLAAGGAAAMGTGATDSIQTERSVQVDVKGDDGAAYLQLDANDDSAFVNNSSPLSIDLAQTLGGGGSGVNNDGTTEARPGFTMKNQHSDTMYIEANNPGANTDITGGGVDLQLIAVNNADSLVGSGGNSAVLFDRSAEPGAAEVSGGTAVQPGYINQDHGRDDRNKTQLFGTERAAFQDKPAYLELGPGEDTDVIVRVVANDASTGDLVVDGNIEIEAFDNEGDVNNPARFEVDDDNYVESP